MNYALLSILSLLAVAIAYPTAPNTDCSVLGCAWAGGLCLDVGEACDDKTACKDAYKAASFLRHCNKTDGVATSNDPCVTGTPVSLSLHPALPPSFSNPTNAAIMVREQARNRGKRVGQLRRHPTRTAFT